VIAAGAGDGDWRCHGQASWPQTHGAVRVRQPISESPRRGPSGRVAQRPQAEARAEEYGVRTRASALCRDWPQPSGRSRLDAVVNRCCYFRNPLDARTEERSTPPTSNPSVAGEHWLDECVREQLTESLRAARVEVARRDVDAANGQRTAACEPPVDAINSFEERQQGLAPRDDTLHGLLQHRRGVKDEVLPRLLEPTGILRKRPHERVAVMDESECGRGLLQLRSTSVRRNVPRRRSRFTTSSGYGWDDHDAGWHLPAGRVTRATPMVGSR
jgi:hypothetical protein